MPLRVWWYLLTIYLLWGSTYLGIRIAVRTIPPLVLASVRYLLAGSVLLAWSLPRRPDGDRIGLPELKAAAVIGGTMVLLGNGGVAWAEQRAVSGAVALVMATVPMWMAFFDKTVVGRRLHRLEALGLVIGFAGVGIVVTQSSRGPIHLIDTCVALLAAVGWAIGSLYSRDAPAPRTSLLGIALWMLAGGLLLALGASVTGEFGKLDVAAISGESWLALVYLIVFGTLVGMTRYLWLLRSARTSLVATYAYVNPVVAVLLGTVILGERLGWLLLFAGGLIVASVLLVVSAPHPER